MIGEKTYKIINSMEILRQYGWQLKTVYSGKEISRIFGMTIKVDYLIMPEERLN